MSMDNSIKMSLYKQQAARNLPPAIHESNLDVVTGKLPACGWQWMLFLFLR